MTGPHFEFFPTGPRHPGRKRMRFAYHHPKFGSFIDKYFCFAFSHEKEAAEWFFETHADTGDYELEILTVWPVEKY